MARPPLLSAAGGRDGVPEPEPRRGRSPSPPQPPLGVPAPRIAARRSRSAARQSEPRPPSAGTARGSPCCRAPSIPRAAAGNGDHFRRGAAGYHGNRPAGCHGDPLPRQRRGQASLGRSGPGATGDAPARGERLSRQHEHGEGGFLPPAGLWMPPCGPFPLCCSPAVWKGADGRILLPCAQPLCLILILIQSSLTSVPEETNA